jgi:hypothetical protein
MCGVYFHAKFYVPDSKVLLVIVIISADKCRFLTACFWSFMNTFFQNTYVYRICIKWQQYFGPLQTATAMCSTVHIPGFRSRLGNRISWDVLWFPSVHIYNTPLSNYFIVIVVTKITIFNK